MRKYILLLCTICMGLVSCVKENMTGVEADGLTTFKVVYADPSTKTVLEGLTPMWTPADKISIYDGKNNQFSNSLTSPAKTAEFKGKLEGQGASRSSFFAASPYNENYTFSFVSSYIGGLEVFPVQSAVEGSYDPASAPAAAFTSDNNLSFYNAYSLVKFTIVSDGVTEVKLEGKQDEVLAGKMNVAKANPVRLTVTSGEKAVTLAGEFKNGSTYYISTIPASLASGLKVTLKKADGTTVESMNYSGAVALERSCMVNLGSLSLDPKESVLPSGPGEENDGVVYLMPNSNWLEAGARFAAYFFEEGMPETWVDLVVDTVSGVYKCDVPEGYTNVIFVRMNPSSSDNSWEDGVKWGQTGNLKVPSGNDVCFVLEANSWDAGSWTSYPPTVDVEPNPGTPGEDIETAGTIYMRPNSNWLEAGARFAAYFFEGANNVWVSMVADVEANVFKCDVPSGFSNVIFVRMNPAVSENRWNTDTDTDTTKPVWNQTADLFVPGAGSTSICYVVTPGTWGEEGYWTTYPPVVTDPEPENPAPGTQPNMLYLNPWQWTSDGARLEAYFFGNGDTWVTMTDSDKDGCYECEIPDGFANVIFVRMDPAKPEHSWDSKWNQTEDQVIASGMNCFTITSWEGGQDGKSKGTWSTK